MRAPIALASAVLASVVFVGGPASASESSRPMLDHQSTGCPLARQQPAMHLRSHGAALPAIHGCVADPYDITVNPEEAPAGRYRIVVRDKSKHSNWHMTGPAGSLSSGIKYRGRLIFRVDLTPGTYMIQSDRHTQRMQTTLIVV
jgi:hypothetical protein